MLKCTKALNAMHVEIAGIVPTIYCIEKQTVTMNIGKSPIGRAPD
jgi:hypothetical protein